MVSRLPMRLDSNQFLREGSGKQRKEVRGTFAAIFLQRTGLLEVRTPTSLTSELKAVPRCASSIVPRRCLLFGEHAPFSHVPVITHSCFSSVFCNQSKPQPGRFGHRAHRSGAEWSRNRHDLHPVPGKMPALSPPAVRVAPKAHSHAQKVVPV